MVKIACPISTHALLSPTQPALITHEKTWNYLELDRLLHSLCAYLDVAPGSRVSFVATSTLQTILLLFALFRLRAIACPLSTRTPAQQLPHLVEQLRATYLAPESLPLESKHGSPALLDSDQLATFLFTSGSSGKPKIACHTLGNHIVSAQTANPFLRLSFTSRYLLSLPLYHVSGIAILFRCFCQGAAVVLSHALTQFAISHASLVPTQLYRLLQQPPSQHQLQCLLLGGAGASPTLLQRAEATGLPLFLSYGLTEMSSLVALAPPGYREGIILPEREVKIENQEIYVRGKTLFQGYWKPETKTIESPGEWFATRDLGQLSDRGELTVIGRKDRLFISGGENIQPEEIEQILCTIPGIVAATVVPVADAEFGERPIAYIRDETNSHTLESIREALRDKLPAFKHPVQVMNNQNEIAQRWKTDLA